MIKVNFRNLEVKEFPDNTTLLDISKEFSKRFNYPILVGKINDDLSILSTKVDENCNVDFYDRSSEIGNEVYSNSCIFMLVYAVKKIFNRDVYIENSVDRGVKCKVDVKLTEKIVNQIEEEMKEIVKQNIPFKKVNVKRREAIKYFKSMKQIDKAENLKYISNSYISLYKLENIYDFFYNKLAYSTKNIDNFKLTYLNDNEFILNYPDTKNPECTLPYRHKEKVAEVFDDYLKWQERIKITAAYELNALISEGHSNEIIRLSEAYYDQQIYQMVEQIYKNKEKIKLILLGGPSSSGKTTTSKKLQVYLGTKGIKAYKLSIDDYYLDRKELKKDSNGEYDFELLDSIDVNLFNSHLTDLLEGRAISKLRYNFKTGRKEQTDYRIQLEKGDMIIVEGLHALNDELTSSVLRKNKFKIFISPFTQLNIDNHNRIHTTDTRKLRRIVRDSIRRNASASETLKMWKKVSEGEQKYIFPFQNDVDVIVNSSLLYEIGVLKTYTEPLLFSVKPEDKEYIEALRLINFLRNFLPIPSYAIPKDSLLREFIGGSGFDY